MPAEWRGMQSSACYGNINRRAPRRPQVPAQEGRQACAYFTRPVRRLRTNAPPIRAVEVAVCAESVMRSAAKRSEVRGSGVEAWQR